jgi:aldehyde dehydrogenase (NAD+)
VKHTIARRGAGLRNPSRPDGRPTRKPTNTLSMKNIDHIYVDGAFVVPHGTQCLELVNPATESVIGRVVLGDREDARRAIAAAARALPAFARTTRQERIELLQRLHDAVLRRTDELRDATIQEYGGPVARSSWVSAFAASTFADAATVLRGFEFSRIEGESTVLFEPVGVCALITPWNANAGSICSKLAMALAAGCTTVIKPSEFSAIQTRILVEAFHEAGAPRGVINVLDGRGSDVGAELCTNPDVARISFTGSNGTGAAIARLAVDTMKRVTLGLGGKSPAVVLEDADFERAIPSAVDAAFQNSGQACIAASRLLVAASRLDDAKALIERHVQTLRVGDPADPATRIGPMATRAQFDRVQSWIQAGMAEGARLLCGGPGRPAGLEVGYYVRPTVFVDVRNDMKIAQEEIFGPVLCVIAYETEDEAIEIANDSRYGLHAYVYSGDEQHARAAASRLHAGRVAINGFKHDPMAPFGGYKQSGIGREYGVAGLESFLETKAVMRVG